jgi:putative membrane protein
MDRSSATAGNLSGSSRLEGQDATFLQRALEMGRLEVAQAQVALQSATRSDTKTAARMLVVDHQRANQQLEQLASRKGWSLPTESQAAESDQARASSSSGSFDDDRFMADQIRMHRDAISLFRAQSSSGSDPELRQFASDQLPHLEHHLEMLQGERTQK